LKIKLQALHFADIAGIQKAETDELQKVQKEKFSAAAFQKLYDLPKANGAYLGGGKYVSFSVSSIF